MVKHWHPAPLFNAEPYAHGTAAELERRMAAGDIVRVEIPVTIVGRDGRVTQPGIYALDCRTRVLVPWADRLQLVRSKGHQA